METVAPLVVAGSSEEGAAEGSAEEREAVGAGGGSAGVWVGSGAGWRSIEEVDAAAVVVGVEVGAEVGGRALEGGDPLSAGCDVCDCGSREAACPIWTPPSSFAGIKTNNISRIKRLPAKNKASISETRPYLGVLLNLSASLPGLRENGADHAL